MAATTKKNSVRKASARKGAAKGKGKAKAAPKRDLNGELPVNAIASLKALCKAPAVGLTRKQLQERIDGTITGYPRLVAKGYAKKETYEGEREHYYVATSAGRAYAKKN